MLRSYASLTAGALLMFVVGLSARAEGLTCAAGFRGGIYPSNPPTLDVYSPIPANGSIWLVCDPEYCSSPTLTNAEGETIPLEEAERWSRPNSGVGPAEVAVIRYRPSIPFELGATYRVSGRPFEVAADEGSPPALPWIKSRGYIHGGLTPSTAAYFQLEYPKGLLVADVAPPDDDPRQSIALDFWVTSDDPSSAAFMLGTDDCGGNFSAAAPGVSTQVRFGILDAAGRFSGWTRFYDVNYPEDGADLPTEVFLPGDELPPPDVSAAEDESVAAVEPTPAVVESTSSIDGVDPIGEAPSAAPSLAGGREVQGGCALTAVSAHSPSQAWWLLAAGALAGRWAARRRPGTALSCRG
jgi:hypothetical protein